MGKTTNTGGKKIKKILAKWGKRTGGRVAGTRKNKHVTGAVSAPAQQVISNKSAAASRKRGIE